MQDQKGSAWTLFTEQSNKNGVESSFWRLEETVMGCLHGRFSKAKKRYRTSDPLNQQETKDLHFGVQSLTVGQ